MRIVLNHTFDAPAETVWAMFHDPASHVAKFEGMGHHGVTVLEEEHTEGDLRIIITREVDIDGIPGFAKRFVKPRNTVVSDDHWQDLGDGTYGGRFKLETKGTPLELSGTTKLTPNCDKTDYEVTVEIEVKVPLVGGKLTGFGKGIVEKQLTEEFALGDAWLTDH